MRIAYGFMKYPSPAQPFAISDVKAVEMAGHQVETYALSGRHDDHDAAVRTYGLRLNDGAHGGWRTAAAMLDPRNLDVAAFLIGLILRRLARRPGELARALALAPRLIETTARLRRDPPDVLHVFWGHYPSLLLLLAARFHPQTVRSLFLGAYDLTTHFFSLTPEAARVADVVLTHAEENRPLVEAAGAPAARIRVVHRGVPLDLADGPAPSKEPGLICAAANFQREKNLDLVLHAFAALRRTHPAARLAMIGDGEARASLKALAAALDLGDSVTFTGHLPRDALFAWMRRAEVFVFLSTKASERLPNVVKEAMLAECWCVSSRTPGIEELVVDGETGEILDGLDPERVAARVAAALADPERPERQAAAAARVRALFSSDATMRAHIDAWRAARRARAPEQDSDASFSAGPDPVSEGELADRTFANAGSS